MRLQHVGLMLQDCMRIHCPRHASPRGVRDCRKDAKAPTSKIAAVASPRRDRVLLGDLAGSVPLPGTVLSLPRGRLRLLGIQPLSRSSITVVEVT